MLRLLPTDCRLRRFDAGLNGLNELASLQTFVDILHDVRVLDLQFNRLGWHSRTLVGFKLLSSFPELTTLHLGASRFTNPKELASLLDAFAIFGERLRDLSLPECYLDAASLHHVLSLCPGLQRLDLAGNPIQHQSDTDAQLWASAFVTLANLAFLDLSKNQIDVSSLKIILPSLKNLSMLKSLNLSVNNVLGNGSSGLLALELLGFASLETVILQRISMDVVAFQSLLDLWLLHTDRLPRLKCVDLRFNFTAHQGLPDHLRPYLYRCPWSIYV